MIERRQGLPTGEHSQPAGAGRQRAVGMARGGPKSGGSSTMGSIAAHEGEEEGKMKRSTGGRNLDSGEEGAQGKNGQSTSFLSSRAGND